MGAPENGFQARHDSIFDCVFDWGWLVHNWKIFFVIMAC